MKWLKRLQMMRISKIVIAVSLALSVIFAGFTIYGNKVGNFIINVSNDGAHIAATMKEDLSDLSSRLSVSGLEGQGATTYEDIPRLDRQGDRKQERHRISDLYGIQFLSGQQDRTLGGLRHEPERRRQRRQGDPISCVS